MREIIAYLFLIPSVILLQISRAIDPKPVTKILIELFKQTADKAGVKLVEK